jgi:glutamine amidotransferase
LSLSRFHPVGSTDSEHVFCHLIAHIAELEAMLDTRVSWAWLHQLLTDLNQRGKLNCLLSDGRRLFCYHDAGAWKGLTLRKLNIRSHVERRFEDIGIAVDVKKDDESVSANHGYVIATCALSETGWMNFLPGELIVFEGGHIAYSSHAEYRFAPVRSN